MCPATSCLRSDGITTGDCHHRHGAATVAMRPPTCPPRCCCRLQHGGGADPTRPPRHAPHQRMGRAAAPWRTLHACIVRAYGPYGRRMRCPYDGLLRRVTNGAWGRSAARWAKHTEAWSSLRSSWLMLEAEKLCTTASFRGQPRCAHFVITPGLLPPSRPCHGGRGTLQRAPKAIQRLFTIERAPMQTNI